MLDISAGAKLCVSCSPSPECKAIARKLKKSWFNVEANGKHLINTLLVLHISPKV